MRGKLRDKRVDVRRDQFKRETAEHRRPSNRRENRSLFWLNQQLEEEDGYLTEDEAGDELKAPVPAVPVVQPVQSAQPGKK